MASKNSCCVSTLQQGLYQDISPLRNGGVEGTVPVLNDRILLHCKDQRCKAFKWKNSRQPLEISVKVFRWGHREG